MADVLVIEGFDSMPGHRCRGPAGQFTSCSTGYTMHSYDDFSEILPPDVAGYGANMLTQLVPTREELTQTIAAGGSMAGAIIGGLAAERLLLTKLRIPKGVLPFVHVGLGVVAGRVVAQWNPALGVGVAAGFAGLGVLRFLQTFLGVKVDLSGLDTSFELADFGEGADSDLLPPELSGADDDDDDFAGIGIEEDAMSGYIGQVVAEERSYNMAGLRIG